MDYCGTVQEAEKNDTMKSTSPSQEFYEYVYCIYLWDDQTFNNIILDRNLKIQKITMFLHYSRRVLKATEGIETFGGIRWELLGAVFGAWVGSDIWA